jgi:hypothetical protein
MKEVDLQETAIFDTEVEILDRLNEIRRKEILKNIEILESRKIK